MLHGYRCQIDAARGAGMAGLGEHARLSSTVRALMSVVDEDHDPRGSDATGGIAQR